MSEKPSKAKAPVYIPPQSAEDLYTLTPREPEDPYTLPGVEEVPITAPVAQSDKFPDNMPVIALTAGQIRRIDGLAAQLVALGFLKKAEADRSNPALISKELRRACCGLSMR